MSCRLVITLVTLKQNLETSKPVSAYFAFETIELPKLAFGNELMLGTAVQTLHVSSIDASPSSKWLQMACHILSIQNFK